MYNGDTKRVKNIKFYTEPKTEDEEADMLQTLTMILGLIAFAFRVKWAIWMAIVLFICCWLDAKNNTEGKFNIFSSVMLLGGLFNTYFSPQAMIERKKGYVVK